MSSEDRMSIGEQRKYSRRMQKRYRQADRKERGQLLDEMEAVTELHRKSLIRLMNGDLDSASPPTARAHLRPRS